MSFLKKRSGAIIILIVVIILGSFYAANRSLSVETRKISNYFSDGVYDTKAGYKLPSVKSQLEVRAAASNNLISVGSQYNDAKAETDALRKAHDALVNGLTNALGPDILYDQNRALQTAFDALYAKISTFDPTTNKSFAKPAEENNRMINAARVIEQSSYNGAVRDFNSKVLDVFPTNYIKVFAMVQGPQLFE